MMTGKLEEGTILDGRYRIVRSLGQGGMGTVYLAEHLQLDTIVAVKEVYGPRQDEAEYQAALEQCQQEARFLVRLHHANLPKVNDAFIENDRFYLIMEFIEGITLETRLQQAEDHRLNVESVVEWGLQIADVLAYLHSQDPAIIFRDLKPANVMIEPDGAVRLIDFGIARRFQPNANKDTALLGSVGYSPPEQFGRHQTDPRSDIYAFGATLHHLLTGRDPAAEPFRFPPASTLVPNIPASLSRLLSDCVALDASARPQGIHEVALRLLAVRDELARIPAQEAVPTVGEVTPGGAGGPRIISTKLAEAEAQKRRSGRQEGSRLPSRELKRRRPHYALIGMALLLLLLSLPIAYFLRLAQKPRNTSGPKVQNPPMKSEGKSGLGNDPVKAQVVPPTTAAPQMTPGDPAPPAVTELPVLMHLETQGIIYDNQSGYALRLLVTGMVRGKANKAGTVAVFFYDEMGQPIPARDPQSLYSTRDGQLSVGLSLAVQSDPQSFEMLFDVPASQFPLHAAPSVLKVRSAFFVEGERIGASDMRRITGVPAAFFAEGSQTPVSNGAGSSSPP